MKVTICELPDHQKAFASAWEALVSFVRTQQSDLVLLPELPFSSWFARTPQKASSLRLHPTWAMSMNGLERVK